jgi:hypothetical protein
MTREIDDIAARYAEEQQHPRLAIHPDDVPGSYDAITPQWLTGILCRDVAGAEVLAVSQGERDDGSSNRRRLFLTYNEAGQRAGLPPTVFCKSAETLNNRLMLGSLGTALAEVNFFNKIRGRLDIEAQTAWHAAFDPERYTYIVVMRDLGGFMEFCDERTEIDRDMAVSLVTLLATLHGTFYEHPELGTETMPFRPWSVFWDGMMPHFPDFEAACDRAVLQAESVIPPRLFARRSEIWPATIASVRQHDQLPRTLIHCDVHLKNWYVTPARQMGLADWQILSVGHWSRDFIYAVTTALSIENRRAWLPDLLRIYLDRMAELGVPRVSTEEAMLNCRQQLFTALAFWTVTLVPATGMPPMQPERTTYRFIERMAAAIDDLDALDSFA